MDISNYPVFEISGMIGPGTGDILGLGQPEVSPDNLRKFLNENKEAQTIVLEIRSNGGYVDQGFEMYDMLKTSGKEIITIGYKVDSIATLLFLTGSKRFISEHSSFTIHNAAISAESFLTMPRLTAEELEQIAEQGRKTDKRILDAYCKVLGEDKRASLLALMAADSDLGAKGAVKYGFATGYWNESKTKPKSTAFANAICIDSYFVNLIKTKKEMEDTKKWEELSKKTEKLFKATTDLLKKFSNDTSVVSGGTSYVVLGEGDDMVGKKVVKADADGMPTEEAAPEGDLVLEDGRTLVIDSAGLITEVKEAVDVEVLKAELDNKNKEIAQLNKKVSDMSGAFQDAKKTVDLLKTEFENFKKQVPGDPKKKEEFDPEAGKKAWAAMSTSQRLLHLRKEAAKSN